MVPAEVTPRYPIYIPSKGRWESRLTVKALDKMAIPYRVVVQPQDYDNYAAVIGTNKLLVLPFDDNISGLLRARNWIWEHSIAEGHRRHWQIDDNIRCFGRLLNSQRIPSNDAAIFSDAERHTDMFSNVAQSGLNYQFLAKQGEVTSAWTKPFLLNTRIYSCTLNSNTIPFRYRARYNDDTDLSLQVKAGYCTILYQAFLCYKIRTMVLKGGNTDELYKQTADFDGRLEMARSLYCQHPDVVKITRKWGRWQHQVNYKPFKGNKLIPVDQAQ